MSSKRPPKRSLVYFPYDKEEYVKSLRSTRGGRARVARTEKPRKSSKRPTEIYEQAIRKRRRIAGSLSFIMNLPVETFCKVSATRNSEDCGHLSFRYHRLPLAWPRDPCCERQGCAKHWEASWCPRTRYQSGLPPSGRFPYHSALQTFLALSMQAYYLTIFAWYATHSPNGPRFYFD